MNRKSPKGTKIVKETSRLENLKVIQTPCIAPQPKAWLVQVVTSVLRSPTVLASNLNRALARLERWPTVVIFKWLPVNLKIIIVRSKDV